MFLLHDAVELNTIYSFLLMDEDCHPTKTVLISGSHIFKKSLKNILESWCKGRGRRDFYDNDSCRPLRSRRICVFDAYLWVTKHLCWSCRVSAPDNSTQ